MRLLSPSSSKRKRGSTPSEPPLEPRENIPNRVTLSPGVRPGGTCHPRGPLTPEAILLAVSFGVALTTRASHWTSRAYEFNGRSRSAIHGLVRSHLNDFGECQSNQSVELTMIVTDLKVNVFCSFVKWFDLKRIHIPGCHSFCPRTLDTSRRNLYAYVRMGSGGPQRNTHLAYRNADMSSIWDEKAREACCHSTARKHEPAAEKQRRESSFQFLASRIPLRQR